MAAVAASFSSGVAAAATGAFLIRQERVKKESGAADCDSAAKMRDEEAAVTVSSGDQERDVEQGERVDGRSADQPGEPDPGRREK